MLLKKTGLILKSSIVNPGMISDNFKREIKPIVCDKVEIQSNKISRIK
jgi:hypothetical protein